jgi:hypothetical protein
MLKIALMGAGGKMGCRIVDGLKGKSDYQVRAVEISPAGIARLTERGVTVTPQAQALADADIVVLAVPDTLIGKVTHEIVPTLRPGTIVFGLDPAAAYAGVMPKRSDVTYFVCHPCHPPLFGDETDAKARKDYFGGVARMDLVCALHQGPEDHYAIGARIAKDMFAPIDNVFRITVEQMAILEPALVETTNTTLIVAMRETYNEAVRMGVPEKAARSFFLGHLRTALAIVLGFSDFPMSDGAKYAAEQAKSLIFKPNWMKNIMNLAGIRKSVAEITRATQK